MADEETHKEQGEESSNIIYYVIGAVLLVVVIGAGYLLKSRATQPTDNPPVADTSVTQVINTGPITKLGCEKQYYNPVVGLPKYYLSTEGVDVTETTKVTCNYTVTVNKEVVAKDTVDAKLTANAERKGNVFTCTTKQLTVPAQVPAKVDVAIQNDKNEASTCSATFLLPRP